MFRLAMHRTLSLWALLTLGLSSMSLSAAAATGNTIRGSAQNLSRGQPAAGDQVILVRLNRMPDGEMQPNAAADSKTDAQGGFTFVVPDPDKTYLVRVVHQGVSYDQQASVGDDNLSISVFDAAPRVATITGSIEIVRVGTRVAANQKLLHVSDMYELRNQSSPPMTQAGASTFDVYLPASAKIDSVLAAGPSSNLHEKIGLMIPALPVRREPGHYTVNFPLRPGAARFAFNYDVRYPGHATFQARHAYGVQQFAVMIPATMHFFSRSAFQKLPTVDNDYQVHAAMPLKAGSGPAFEISGDGLLPRLEAKNQPVPQARVLPNSNVPDSVGTLRASPPRADSKSEKTLPLWPWQVLTGGLILICILLLLRAHEQQLAAKRGMGARPSTPPNASASLLESLKEEWLQLEADRARGLISPEEYCSARLALAETVKRMVVGPKSSAAMVLERSEKPRRLEEPSRTRSCV